MIFEIHGSLGDEVALTGAVREFARQYPKENLLVRNNYPDVFLHNPHLGKGTEDNRLIAYIPLSPNNRIGNYTYAYGQFLRIKVFDTQPEIFLTSEEKNMFQPQYAVGIDTWAGWPTRRWPFDHFKRLVDLFHQTFPNLKVIEVGKTVPDCFQERRKSGLPNVDESFLDKLSIRQTASLISSLRLFVGNDSGLAHVAAAVKTPQIVMYSSAIPWYGRAYRNTFPLFNMNSCDKCPEAKCSKEKFCMADILPEDVISTCLAHSFFY